MKTVMSPSALAVIRNPITRLEIRDLLGGRYAVVAFTPDDVQLLAHGPLDQVIRAGEYASAHLQVPVRASCLAPRGIRGWQRVDRFVPQRPEEWALGVKRGPLAFSNADELYRHLVHGGFTFWGPHFIAHGAPHRVHLYRSHETLDSMLAWEIALHRLENHGTLPTHLDLPEGACPRCLSRHVVTDGPLSHCQECHHAVED